MDFSLSDHQLLIRDTVREFMSAEVRPHVKEWERTDHFPLDAIRKLGTLGCCGMLTPEEWGGPGLDTISYVLMLEEVAKVHTAMSTAIGVTNSAVQVPLLMFGTEAQKSRYLPRLASGEILGSFCLTEPAAGSDAAGIQSTAVPVAQGESSSPAALSSGAPPSVSEGGSSLSSSLGAPGAGVAPGILGSSTLHYVLNGTKTWVTNGSAAGVYIVFAKTQPELGGKGISAFLVEPGTPGFKIGRHEDKMGQRSSPSVEILLNDCIVPAANRIGEEGQGLKIALTALDGGRIGIAAQAVGLAQGALDESVKYAKARKAFGKSIGEFQAIQWMLADMHTEIEAARALLYHAAFLKDCANTQNRHSERSPRSEESLFPSSGAPPSVSDAGPSLASSLGAPGAVVAPGILGSSSARHSSQAGAPPLVSKGGAFLPSSSGSHSSRAKLYASEMVNRVVYKAVQIHGSLGYSRESEVERMYRDARVITIYEGTSEVQRMIIARDLLSRSTA